MNEAIEMIRDLVRSHPATTHGLCRLCGHYGDDCTGSRAVDYLARYDQRQFDAKMRKNRARRTKHAVLTSLGLKRVRGSQGGIYYE